MFTKKTEMPHHVAAFHTLQRLLANSEAELLECMYLDQPHPNQLVGKIEGPRPQVFDPDAMYSKPGCEAQHLRNWTRSVLDDMRRFGVPVDGYAKYMYTLNTYIRNHGFDKACKVVESGGGYLYRHNRGIYIRGYKHDHTICVKDNALYAIK